MSDNPKEISAMLAWYDRQRSAGTTLGYSGYVEAVRSELAELGNAVTTSEQWKEYGDLMGSVVLLGAELGFRRPLHCLEWSRKKIQKRVGYIQRHANTAPGEPGYREEFMRLWEQSKEEE